MVDFSDDFLSAVEQVQNDKPKEKIDKEEKVDIEEKQGNYYDPKTNQYIIQDIH